MSMLKAIATGEFEGSVSETRLWRAVIARTIQEWISGPLILLCAVAIKREWAIFTTDQDFTNYVKVLPISIYAPRK